MIVCLKVKKEQSDVPFMPPFVIRDSIFSQIDLVSIDSAGFDVLKCVPS